MGAVIMKRFRTSTYSDGRSGASSGEGKARVWAGDRGGPVGLSLGDRDRFDVEPGLQSCATAAIAK
jgi:hypothetical protein